MPSNIRFPHLGQIPIGSLIGEFGFTHLSGFLLRSGAVSSEEEIRQIITENDFLLDYGMAIFGENVQDGEIDFNNIIDYFKMNVYGVVIKKSILVYTGCYNEELTAGIDYELAVRVAYYAEKYNYNGIYGVLCSSEENLFSQEAGSSDIQEADNAAGSGLARGACCPLSACESSARQLGVRS